MKKWKCTICGEIVESDIRPEKCPLCKAPGEKFEEVIEDDMNWATEHEDYEASQWPVFLPKLYELWKDHPDPSQNVKCNLEVCLGEDGKYHYVDM